MRLLEHKIPLIFSILELSHGNVNLKLDESV